MNPEVKTKWTTALRSGEYQQGRDYLKSKCYNTYCCLGVLTDLFIKENNLEWDYDEETGLSSLYGESLILSEYVASWAGLDTNPVIEVFDEDEGEWGSDEITNLNDGMNLSFKQIAEIIEEHL